MSSEHVFTSSSEAGRWRAGLVAFICLAASSVAASAEDDKSQYNLFNPVPESKLREFDPDRPGQSHDPTTVDAGWVQFETSIFEYTYDPRGAGAVTTRRWIYGNPEVRLGVTNWAELQVGGPVGNILRTGGADMTRAHGYGDTTLGAKVNLLGNDGGDHLLALLPTVKTPTAARNIGNGHAEFTFSVPYNYQLTPEIELTAEPSVAALRNSANTHYRDGYGFITGIDYTIAKRVVTSLEVSTQTSTAHKESTQWAVSPSVAVYLSKHLQVDAGANLGLNKATPRYNPYLGVSARF